MRIPVRLLAPKTASPEQGMPRIQDPRHAAMAWDGTWLWY
jgi:hypothetical protein